MLVAVSELETGPTDDEAASAALCEMSSDAAKDGTDRPAIAVYSHGASWAIALRPCGVVGPLQLSIPVLEFLAIFINFFMFGPRIPTGVRIVVMTDSLTSVDVLADGTAHAPLMQWLHTRLLVDDHFKRLAPLALIGHGYSDTNAMSDVHSRGYDDLVARLCAALRVRHVALDAPSAALELLDALRAEHYALLGVVDGKRPSGVDSSEPTAISIKRRAVDSFGGSVRIGEPPTRAQRRYKCPPPPSASRLLRRRRRPHQSGPRRRPTFAAARRHQRRSGERSAISRLRCSLPPSRPPAWRRPLRCRRRRRDGGRARRRRRRSSAHGSRTRLTRPSCDQSPSRPAFSRHRRCNKRTRYAQ